MSAGSQIFDHHNNDGVMLTVEAIFGNFHRISAEASNSRSAVRAIASITALRLNGPNSFMVVSIASLNSQLLQ